MKKVSLLAKGEVKMKKTKEKKLILKLYEALVGMACLAFLGSLGVLIGGCVKYRATVQEYKDTAIYQKLKQEDEQRITNALKNEEITSLTHGMKLKELDNNAKCEEYIYKDHEENKKFQPELKESQGLVAGGMSGVAASSMCMIGVYYALDKSKGKNKESGCSAELSADETRSENTEMQIGK